jgi:biopolymer transport protein ExbD
MGDRSVPYALLKKIMYTCAQAGYTDVSLAVEQKASKADRESDV